MPFNFMIHAEKQVTYGWPQIVTPFLHLGFKDWRLEMSMQHENSDTKDVSGEGFSSFFFIPLPCPPKTIEWLVLHPRKLN